MLVRWTVDCLEWVPAEARPPQEGLIRRLSETFRFIRRKRARGDVCMLSDEGVFSFVEGVEFEFEKLLIA